ncbi:hypothetical protein TrVE_jg2296 [Triparma verrucosa]|uniref:Uncharacterized protein n=1 Tax=Triparma verrucosa TaxID=1606542 RepID=A0A9W7FJE1_9STRA|nr:hypothetical protein TrVE_jg2296 [Triparma verrucosa]
MDSKNNVETSLTITLTPPTSPPNTFTLATTLPESSISPLFSGSEWAGTRIWRAAELSVHWFLVNLVPPPHSFLELGAGLGLLGHCLSRLNPESTYVITDVEALIEQLEYNIPSSQNNLKAAGLDWSEDGLRRVELECNNNRPFDLIVSTDCVYKPLYGDSYVKLAECVVSGLKRNVNAVSVHFMERRNGDGVEEWVEILEGEGLKVEKEDWGSKGCEEMQWSGEGGRAGVLEVYRVVNKK